jgi:polyisoprenoid-binding protein YceI
MVFWAIYQTNEPEINGKIHTRTKEVLFMNFIKMAATVAFVGLVAQPVLASNEWTIDPAHTSANFTVRHMMVSNVHGRFGKVAGQAKYDGKDLKGAEVEATIDAGTVDTSDEKRDGHLKSPDFFDVAKYPTITFKSTEVKKTSSGFDLIGELTMHGTTKPITLHAEKISEPVKDGKGNLHVGTSATAEINRKDFGVSFNKQLDNGGAMVGDEVKIVLDVELTKNKETASAQ